ncbi:class I SAM-dependent methyltransferase [Massilia sp. R2A-15]|uniref:class I SAM-dependent methyltransferase n=1 Tax=Massilia sp. R2A-15 TaxID=3064278 RepID=UPI002733DAAE|nr:class I SAM-dependent methyltransferase [Massilia sp. R2A-15]WLI87860.1 class I SAM-dependent methyltransferase [Massilia sp. R2A-15]
MSQVSSWVARWAPVVPAGEVLDLACGTGRHARHFAALGHAVLAVDRDAEALALAAGQGIVTQQFDLESDKMGSGPQDQTPVPIRAANQGLGSGPADLTPGLSPPRNQSGSGPADLTPFTPGRYAGIVVTNYLHRPLMAQLAASLRPDGVLIYETFAIGNEAFGKPSNPAFLLAPGELLDIARACGLRVLAFEDGYTATPKPAMVQRLCACGPVFPVRNALLDSFEHDF